MVRFYSLKRRKHVNVPKKDTKLKTLKNKAVARTATHRGEKLFRIVKGSPTGRRSGRGRR